MPIYEYQCDSCGEVTEAIQKFSDAPLETCEKCGGKLNKLMSLNAFHLKGSGWYVTDYKGKNSSTTGTGGSCSDDSSCSCSSDSSDSASPAPSSASDD